MYVINVIPLIKIPYPNPQILSYFCSEKIKTGGVVKISIRKRKIRAIVIEQKSIEKEKIRLKKIADFSIKPIDKIMSKEPILTEKQLKLLFWIADYYFAPIGLVAKIFLSKKLPAYNKTSLVLTPKTKGLVFSAFKNLKSIIIEDESSPLYRSWGRKPYYNAKDIAIQLAKIHKAKLILKSQLPSIETFYWGENKKYKLLIQNLKFKIQNSLIDMREELRNGNFSIISRELKEKIKNSQKAILYIARRGTSTFILCRECGYVSMCPNCDVPMVYHEDKPSRKLVCHHCGKQDIVPVLCPKCRSAKIKYFGAGTQKVESEIKKLHPNKTVLRLDSDITPKPIDQQKIIEKFNKEKSAILIGSQMILNLPRAQSRGKKPDLVAVISLETILNLPDFRSSERASQTINQLKKMTNKYFLLQTYNPENFTIKTALANDFKKFYNEEIKMRKKFIYPPFSQIIKLSFEHKNPEKAKNEAEILFEKLKTQIRNLKIQNQNLKLSGPTPAFISKVGGKYRWNIIIKSKINDIKIRNGLLIIVPSTWNTEVDPESLL